MAPNLPFRSQSRASRVQRLGLRSDDTVAPGRRARAQHIYCRAPASRGRRATMAPLRCGSEDSRQRPPSPLGTTFTSCSVADERASEQRLVHGGNIDDREPVVHERDAADDRVAALRGPRCRKLSISRASVAGSGGGAALDRTNPAMPLIGRKCSLRSVRRSAAYMREACHARSCPWSTWENHRGSQHILEAGETYLRERCCKWRKIRLFRSDDGIEGSWLACPSRYRCLEWLHTRPIDAAYTRVIPPRSRRF